MTDSVSFWTLTSQSWEVWEVNFHCLQTLCIHYIFPRFILIDWESIIHISSHSQQQPSWWKTKTAQQVGPHISRQAIVITLYQALAEEMLAGPNLKVIFGLYPKSPSLLQSLPWSYDIGDFHTISYSSSLPSGTVRRPVRPLSSGCSTPSHCFKLSSLLPQSLMWTLTPCCMKLSLRGPAQVLSWRLFRHLVLSRRCVVNILWHMNFFPTCFELYVLSRLSVPQEFNALYFFKIPKKLYYLGLPCSPRNICWVISSFIIMKAFPFVLLSNMIQ